jgi:isochorismate synthase EntC
VNDRDELTRRLWLLREQMEQLVCALEIQQLVLLNNRLRWLPMVSENVEHIIEDIRRAEADRVVVARRVCRSFGLDQDASLSELVRAADEPYAGTWRQSRHQLVGLQAEIDELAKENRELTRRGAAAASDVLRNLTGDVHEGHDTYDPHGTTTRLAPTASHFDRTM